MSHTHMQYLRFFNLVRCKTQNTLAVTLNHRRVRIYHQVALSRKLASNLGPRHGFHCFYTHSVKSGMSISLIYQGETWESP
jgi:hypothetical protein